MARNVAVIRGRSRTIAGCVTIVLLYGICAFAVIRKPSDGGVIALLVLGLIGAAAVIRIARAGVVITESGMVVRNWLRTRSVPWSAVVAFSPAADDDRNHSVGVWLTDGRRINCTALTFLGGFTLAGPARYPELAAQSTAANLLADYVDRARRAGRLGERVAAS